MEKINFEQVNFFKSTQTIAYNNLEKKINIENRRFIGNKAKLSEWILKSILNKVKTFDTFTDLFAGTAIIAKSFIPYCKKIIINDILYSNNVIYKAFFENGSYDIKKLQSYSKRYLLLNPEKLEENYFSNNFGNKYFEINAAKIIGFIREDIEKNYINLTLKEYNILLASLIYNIDRIANTVGHYEAYIKKPIKRSKFTFNLIEPYPKHNVNIYQEDANTLVNKIKSDIVYIDPPYNSRQYSRFYHLYETLVKWDKPQLNGVALKPPLENLSNYCTTKALDTFKDLILNVDTKYIAVSYNNTYSSKSNSSRNKLEISDIKSVLETRGKTDLYESSHQYFNAGKTLFNDHKEYLFITKVR